MGGRTWIQKLAIILAMIATSYVIFSGELVSQPLQSIPKKSLASDSLIALVQKRNLSIEKILSNSRYSLDDPRWHLWAHKNVITSLIRDDLLTEKEALEYLRRSKALMKSLEVTAAKD